MNHFAASSFFQCVLYLMFFQCCGVKFMVHVYNFVEERKDIGIGWPGKEQLLIEYGDKQKFPFELRIGEQLALEPKIQFDLEKKDAADEQKFTAFTYKDFPSKMVIVKNDDTLEIYYAVKKIGVYLWDYGSHINHSVQIGSRRATPRKEDLYINKKWETKKY